MANHEKELDDAGSNTGKPAIISTSSSTRTEIQELDDFNKKIEILLTGPTFAKASAGTQIF